MNSLILDNYKYKGYYVEHDEDTEQESPEVSITVIRKSAGLITRID